MNRADRRKLAKIKQQNATKYGWKRRTAFWTPTQAKKKSEGK